MNKILTAMSTLIGISDIKVTDKHVTNYQTNKTGGSPDFYQTTDPPLPVCQVCSNKLHLIVQLYCPLDCSDFHRTLYIFACSTLPCLNKPESWLVYRCQSEVVTSPQPVTPSAKTFNDNWGEDCDDWGGDADDWGASNDDTNVDILGDTWSGTQQSATDWDANSRTSSVETEIVSAGGVNSREHNLVPVKEDSKVDTSDLECELPLEAMCLEDANDSDDSKEHEHVISEDINEVSDDVKSKFFSNVGQASRKIDSQTAVLESYFINVFEDSGVSLDRDAHVNKLLREYERKEGQIVRDVSMESERSAGGDGEKYEKTSLKHGDVYFHKFMKQIAMCPEQCVRYSWNGSPLYLRAPPLQPPQRCTHCNGDLVFELQLMPALVNLLRFTQDTDPSVEFGTVLVLTCRKSCWTGAEGYCTEHVIVQSDPDQDRFKI